MQLGVILFLVKMVINPDAMINFTLFTVNILRDYAYYENINQVTRFTFQNLQYEKMVFLYYGYEYYGFL